MNIILGRLRVEKGMSHLCVITVPNSSLRLCLPSYVVTACWSAAAFCLTQDSRAARLARDHLFVTGLVRNFPGEGR